MPRYWVIAPEESNPAIYDKVWKFDLANNLISVGWHELGDISKMDREQLAAAVAATYPDKPGSTRSLYCNMLWHFFHDIAPGDVVVARRGRKTLAAVGNVIQRAFYSPARNPATQHSSFLEVAWLEQPREKAYPTLAFQMRTVVEITEDQYKNLMEGSGAPTDMDGPVSGDTEPIDQAEFVLEKYLKEFIVSNFELIFKAKLRIYEDGSGANGQQYQTDIGPIDILAVDPSGKKFTVVELKKGRPSDQVVGQVLRYMGWVKKNLCKPDEVVEGLIIARSYDPKLAYALDMTGNIQLKYFKIQFTLSDKPDGQASGQHI